MTWYPRYAVRRLALACLAALSGSAAAQPFTGPKADGDLALYGRWTFDVKSLGRTATSIGPVVTSTTVCLTHGARPAELPLMARPLQGRCVMHGFALKQDHVLMTMQCEDFERATHLTMHLEPRPDGTWKGQYSFGMTLDDDGSGTMHAVADVVARRVGGC